MVEVKKDYEDLEEVGGEILKLTQGAVQNYKCLRQHKQLLKELLDFVQNELHHDSGKWKQIQKLKSQLLNLHKNKIIYAEMFEHLSKNI